jgi:hypothetical protein
VQTSFLHVVVIHFPLAHEYDEEECEELEDNEDLLHLEPMHCALGDSRCAPDEIDCEKV